MAKMLTTENQLPRAPQTLTDDRRIRRFGYFLVFVMLFGVGGWAGSARIDGAAVARGVVTVDSYRQAVQHLEGGIIRKLLVREGEQVQAGQLVVLLDDTQFSSQLDAVRSELGASRAIEARLEAERDGRAEVTFPAELQIRAETDPRLTDLMDLERTVFTERSNDLQSQLNVLSQRILSLNREIEGLDEREKLLSQQVELYEDEVAGLASLAAGGLGDKVRLRQLERELIDVRSDLSQTHTQRIQADVHIEETRLEIEKIQQANRKEVVTQLSEVRRRIFEAQELERRLSDQVRRASVTAPVSGRVVGMEVHTVGAVISPGAKMMDVVPESEQLIIDAEVSPDDIDKVYPGLDADVRFTGLNFRSTPVVHGRVRTVSADRLTGPDGSPYFLARIQVPEDQTMLLGEQPILPGMSAMVYIITGERTAFEYIMRPITDAFASSMRSD